MLIEADNVRAQIDGIHSPSSNGVVIRDASDGAIVDIARMTGVASTAVLIRDGATGTRLTGRIGSTGGSGVSILSTGTADSLVTVLVDEVGPDADDVGVKVQSSASSGHVIANCNFAALASGDETDISGSLGTESNSTAGY